MVKRRKEEDFVECHSTCARAKGNTCKFWGCSHRELYRETEHDYDYGYYMAHSKCSNYMRPKT